MPVNNEAFSSDLSETGKRHGSRVRRLSLVLGGLVGLNVLALVMLATQPAFGPEPQVVVVPPGNAPAPRPFPASGTSRPVVQIVEDRGIMVSADGRSFYRFPRRPDDRPLIPTRDRPAGFRTDDNVQRPQDPAGERPGFRPEDPAVRPQDPNGDRPVIRPDDGIQRPPGYGQPRGTNGAIPGPVRPANSTFPNGAPITGPVEATPATSSSENLALFTIRPFGIVPPGPGSVPRYFASLIAFTGAMVVLALVFPRRLLRMRDVISGSPLRLARLAAIGALTYVAGSILAALLVLVIAGVPLAVTLLLAVSVFSAAGVAALSLALGRRIALFAGLARSQPLLDLVLGMVLLVPLSVIPVAGWVIILSASLIGFGAVVLTRFGEQESQAIGA